MALVTPDPNHQGVYFGFWSFNHLNKVAVGLGETASYALASVVCERRLEDRVALRNVVVINPCATPVNQAVQFFGHGDSLSRHSGWLTG